MDEIQIHPIPEPMSDQTWRKYVCEHLHKGDARMNCLEQGLNDNTMLTKKIDENTDEMVEMFKAMKGGLKVLGWFGTLAKWIGGIAAAVVSVYAAWQAMLKMFSR